MTGACHACLREKGEAVPHGSCCPEDRPTTDRDRTHYYADDVPCAKHSTPAAAVGCCEECTGANCSCVHGQRLRAATPTCTPESTGGAGAIRERRPLTAAERTERDDAIDDIARLRGEVETLRQLNKDTVDGMECLPKCDSYGHEEFCPVANPVAAWRQLRATVARLERERNEALTHEYKNAGEANNLSMDLGRLRALLLEIADRVWPPKNRWYPNEFRDRVLAEINR